MSSGRGASKFGAILIIPAAVPYGVHTSMIDFVFSLLAPCLVALNRRGTRRARTAKSPNSGGLPDLAPPELRMQCGRVSRPCNCTKQGAGGQTNRDLNGIYDLCVHRSLERGLRNDLSPPL